MRDLANWDQLLAANHALYVLDSCFSGLAGFVPQSDVRKLTLQQLSRPGRHLLTAGTAGERTLASDQWGGSVFTMAFLDGIKGAADTNSAFERDGVVSLSELISYVRTRVAIEKSQVNWRPKLTPQIRDLVHNEGEFFFIDQRQRVRSRSRQVQSAPSNTSHPPSTMSDSTARTGLTIPTDKPNIAGVEAGHSTSAAQQNKTQAIRPIAFTVYFDFDKSNLSSYALSLIRDHANRALGTDGTIDSVLVEGHTDSSGTREYNLALSARKANVVRDALIANGIPPELIKVKGYGESSPAKPTADGVREPLNRRTEVFIAFK